MEFIFRCGISIILGVAGVRLYGAVHGFPQLIGVALIVFSLGMLASSGKPPPVEVVTPVYVLPTPVPAETKRWHAFAVLAGALLFVATFIWMVWG